MTGIRVTVTGAEAALGTLQRAVEATANPLALYDEIGASLVVSTQMRFEREISPEGTAWPPSMRAVIEGGRTLTDTARLLQSITHIASDSGVEVGTNVLYAAIHQFGGTIQAKTDKGLVFRGAAGQWVRKRQVTIPPRPFVGLDDDDEAEIVAIAEDWLAEALDQDDAGAAP
jgi:phage virion morphogenesis protein